jgi:hypothetical protein
MNTHPYPFLSLLGENLQGAMCIQGHLNGNLG